MKCDCCRREFAVYDLNIVTDHYSSSKINVCFLCSDNDCSYSRQRCIQYPLCQNLVTDSSACREFCSDMCRNAYSAKQHSILKSTKSVLFISGIPEDEFLI